MIQWTIPNELARSPRPGYRGERHTPVPASVVDAWIREMRDHGIRSIICLLADDQLDLYESLPGGLIEYYREAGFAVEHVPARDHESPPLTEAQLAAVWEAFQHLERPVLIHCSAGVDRSRRAVEYINRMHSSDESSTSKRSEPAAKRDEQRRPSDDGPVGSG